MKKQLLLTSLLFITSLFAFSQMQEDKKGYFAISLGAAIPVGDFTNTDPNNPQSGYARTGFLYEGSFAYRLGINWGIAAVIRGETSPVDDQALANQIAGMYPQFNWQVSADAWSVGAYMGGIYGSFPIDARASSFFEIKGLIGLVSASSPQVSFIGSNGMGTGSVTEESASGTAFGYMLQGGFRLNISPGTSLLLNLDYLNTKPEFTVTTVSSGGGYITNSFSQPIATVNISAGIAFRLM